MKVNQLLKWFIWYEHEIQTTWSLIICQGENNNNNTEGMNVLDNGVKEITRPKKTSKLI